MASSSTRIALVTGGNRGIGLEICRQLAEAGVRVLLGSRSLEAGEAAAAAIGAGVEARQLDVTDAASVAALAARVRDEEGALHILVNNAGFAYKGNTFGAAEAAETIAINVGGTARVCEAFAPLLAPDGVVVNVCSRAGLLMKLKSSALRAEFTAEDLTVAGVHELMARFVAGIEDGSYARQGWPQSMYAVSKVGQVALTKVLARSYGVPVFAICPGYCRTEMTSGRGNKTAAEGATTPVWLALDPAAGVTGRFYAEESEIQWDCPSPTGR